MNNREKIIYKIGIIFFINSAIFSIISIKEWNTATFIALGFIFISIALYFLILGSSDKILSWVEKKSTEVFFYSVLILYCLCTNVTSIIYAEFYTDEVKELILLQTSYILAMSLMILIYHFRGEKARKRDLHKQNNIDSLVSNVRKLNKISDKIQDQEAAEIVKGLAYSLYYTDISRSSEVDLEIENLIESLEKVILDNCPIDQICTELGKKIAMRDDELKEL